MKTNIQICLVLLFFSTMASCSRLDMIGMISGTSPTIDERFEQSQQYNTEHGFATMCMCVPIRILTVRASVGRSLWMLIVPMMCVL